jgi:ribosomal protein S18 acetylase RimI-like enzyme
MLAATQFFRPAELAVAREVFDEALADGPQTDYQSFVAQHDSEVAGWICFGPTPCTQGTFDIYWIVVAPASQRTGIGSALVDFAVEQIKNQNSRLVVVDTSGSERYAATRQFYEKKGFQPAARIKDFYATGDDKVIYVKPL